MLWHGHSKGATAPTGTQKDAQDSRCPGKSSDLRLHWDSREDWPRISSCFSAQGGLSAPPVPHPLQRVLHQAQLFLPNAFLQLPPGSPEQALPRVRWALPWLSLQLSAVGSHEKAQVLCFFIVHLVPPGFCEIFYCISVVKW